MGTLTTHSEGRVVVTHTDDGVEVVQLPARDGVVHAAAEAETPAAPPTRRAVTMPAVGKTMHVGTAAKAKASKATRTKKR